MPGKKGAALVTPPVNSKPRASKARSLSHHPHAGASGCAAGRAGQNRERRQSQADALIRFLEPQCLFHGPDNTAYADVWVNGHRETWPIHSTGFRNWLQRRYWDETRTAVSAEAMSSAQNHIEAWAKHEGPERAVHVRVGKHAAKTFVDLGDDAWRAVEIDATGWRVVAEPPVRFRRAAGMKALPVPARGGSIDALRPFVNVDDDQFVLAVSWTLRALHGHGPYPVLAISGEQGSAKSTFSAILRSLVDPNAAPLRSLPREDRDLFIAATNAHALVFDNASCLPAWLSDSLCRIASGGGFTTRRLYSDGDEKLFNAARPVILNGIEDVITRSDLADRAIFLTLDPIPEERRQTEERLWAAFEAEHPHILGALFDALANGLAKLPSTQPKQLPRMADFAHLSTACEAGLWPPGTFERAYRTNRDETVERVIDAHPVASAVYDLMRTRSEWSGTASEFLSVLKKIAGERVAKSKAWPESPNALSRYLKRIATALRKAGISIEHERAGHNRTRLLRLVTEERGIRSDADRNSSSASSASSAEREKAISANGL